MKKQLQEKNANLEKLLAKKREAEHSNSGEWDSLTEQLHNEEERANKLVSKMTCLETESAQSLKAKNDVERALIVELSSCDGDRAILLLELDGAW